MAEAVKRCGKCREGKRLTASGRWCCDPCNRARVAAYRETNIETVRAKDRARVAAQSPEKKRAKNKAWRERNREHLRAKERERARLSYAKNPEKHRAASRKFYRENGDKCRESHRRWLAANRQHTLDYSKKYRLDNIESVKAAGKRWKSENREATRRRKASERNDLRDSYVKRVLMENRPTSRLEIPQDLIDLKREQLSLLRLSRQLKQELERQDGN